MVTKLYLFFRAIGSDTGGSVRLPASYTGIVGYKPTWGFLSRYGKVSYAPSLDTVGLMTRSVGDAVTCLEGLLKYRSNWRDPTLIKMKENELNSYESLPLEGVTIGVLDEWLEALKGVQGHPLSSILDKLENKSGARLKLVRIPELKGEECLERYYEIACMEASSTLSRYTGNFFEKQNSDISTGLVIELPYEEKKRKYQEEKFGVEVCKRIERGRNLLKDPEGKYLRGAEDYRMKLRKSFDKLFKEDYCDVLIGPTAFSTAPKLFGDKLSENEEKDDDLFTVPANLAGLPAISLPLHGISSGTTGVIGTQLIAAHCDDRLLLRIARELESLFK